MSTSVMDTPEDNKVSSAVSLNLQHGLVPNQCNAFPHPTCITVSSAQEHYPWLLSKLVLSGEGLRELFDSPRPPSCRVTLLEGRDRQIDSCCSVSLDTHEGALSAQQITSLYISPMPRIHSTLCCLHSTCPRIPLQARRSRRKTCSQFSATCLPTR